MKIIYANGNPYITMIVDGGYKNLDFAVAIFFIWNLVCCGHIIKRATKKINIMSKDSLYKNTSHLYFNNSLEFM